MSKPRLSTVELCSQINGKPILQEINFEVEAGALIGVIGPNGAGKSSLLKHLSGYLTPSSGNVFIKGQSLGALSASERAAQISYLPQSNRVEFPYKVTELVSLGLVNNASLSIEEKKQKIAQALKRLDIEYLADRTVDHLSGGEQQLVHLARILLQDTPIILLDEPSASLDIGHEAQLMNILHSLVKEGKTVVVALHNLNTAAEFCDRLMLLQNGRLVADGKPDKILTQELIESIYPYQVQVSTNTMTGNPNILAVKKLKS
ncbi:heme ABC transporter ATP-binding protein [Vibrio breoganii]|uniref:heme ABC transporter ATP-binding protein n=1 Tax=Vibrio breoganii TaxID=553239 RepID=UPI000C83F097|nr:heme ABC transporter ATP-binding protein [Vibrio breoganii]PML97872.1 iron ABC transporter [Vibrio breoganii]PMN65004.1 iron ABC transporter [Vibrio breoganii]